MPGTDKAVMAADPDAVDSMGAVTVTQFIMQKSGNHELAMVRPNCLAAAACRHALTCLAANPRPRPPVLSALLLV